jgi:maleylpyruvate isomerase
VDVQTRQALARIGDATGRLGATAAGLTDAQAAAPSLLPGWTRGHVLTHIARNADGLANLLRWARTGDKTPMYASREARTADIGAGAGRPARVLAADVRAAAAAFAQEAARVPPDAWAATVQALNGGPFPASEVLLMRLSEVEIHHVDLGAGYSSEDWPEEFVGAALPRAADWFRGRDDVPPCQVTVTGGQAFLLGPAPTPAQAGAEAGVAQVAGPAREVLAWLLGRGAGEKLDVRLGSALPVLPPWR